MCKSGPICTISNKQVNSDTIVGLRGSVGGSQDAVLSQSVLYPAGVRLEGSILSPTSLSDMFYPLKSESVRTTQQNTSQAEVVQQWFSMGTFGPVELFQKMSKMKILQMSMVSLIHLYQLSQPLERAQQPLQQSDNWPANIQFLLQYAGFSMGNRQFTAQILSSNYNSMGGKQCGNNSQVKICDSSHSGEERQQVSLPRQDDRLKSAKTCCQSFTLIQHQSLKLACNGPTTSGHGQNPGNGAGMANWATRLRVKPSHTCPHLCPHPIFIIVGGCLNQIHRWMREWQWVMNTGSKQMSTQGCTMLWPAQNKTRSTAVKIAQQISRWRAVKM